MRRSKTRILCERQETGRWGNDRQRRPKSGEGWREEGRGSERGREGGRERKKKNRQTGVKKRRAPSDIPPGAECRWLAYHRFWLHGAKLQMGGMHVINQSPRSVDIE